MGDPKKQRKKYTTPKFPWQAETLQAELKLVGEYGLRNKRELWRYTTMLSKFRSNARSLLSKPPEERGLLENQLLSRLKRMGVLMEDAVLDDVLDLSVEDLLERRLQTIVYRKGLAKTPYQARQLITHGHIAIGDRRVFSPGYLVMKDEEEAVTYYYKSPLADPSHPLRQSIGKMEKPEVESGG